MKKIVIIASITAVAVLVIAFSAGIATGSVGGVDNHYKTGCGPCHGSTESTLGKLVMADTSEPTGALSNGPSTMKPSEKRTFAVALVAAPPGVSGGIDAAVEDSNGNKVGTMAGGQNTRARIGNQEINQKPLALSVTGRVYTFDWTAPTTPGTYTLYVASVAANGTGGPDFDSLPEGVRDGWFTESYTIKVQ